MEFFCCVAELGLGHNDVGGFADADVCWYHNKQTNLDWVPKVLDYRTPGCILFVSLNVIQIFTESKMINFSFSAACSCVEVCCLTQLMKGNLRLGSLKKKTL